MSVATERRIVRPLPLSTAAGAESPATVAPLSLRVNFSWVLAGNVARAVCRYGMLLLLVHFCGLAAAGRYALAVAICSPIWAVVMLGLRGAQVTDARGEFSFADYLAVRLIASGAGLFAVGGLALAGGYDSAATSMILLVALAKLIEGVSDIFRGRLQQRERMDRNSIALFLQGGGGLAFMFVVGSLGGGAVQIVASLPAAMLLTLVFWDLPPCCGLKSPGVETDHVEDDPWRQPLRWPKLAQLAIISFPLAVVGFLIALIPQLPKYVIGAIIGEEALAVYTLVAYWITLGMMVVAALGNATAPRLARYHANGEARAFAGLLARLVALVGAMGLAGVALAALTASKIAALVGQHDPTVPQLIVALSVFAAMLYVTAPLGRGLSSMRHFWSQAMALGAGIAVASATLPWAVHARGMVGAAAAMAVSMGIVAAVSAVLVWRGLRACVHRDSRPLTEAA